MAVIYFGAPWSEFVGERVVLSVPADVARTVEDPFELLVFWDDVINSISDFAGVVRSENYQRFVFDADIGGGYMHSGFPIMALLGSAGNSVNLTIMRQNVGDNWGFFHELGHNHQWNEWTFEGGTEVTCNIFSMYVMNQFLGHPMPDTRPHILLPENLRRYITQYISDGINYPNFQRDYDRGLIFYYQLERIFGWAAYKEVFQRYRDLPGDELPRNDDEKRDTWLIIFSTVVQRNIAELMKSWGIPVSAAAEDQVAHLPDSGFTIYSLLE
ncbi:TRPM8 channel-associated factor homolog [Folsomia candida]|uniref:TRPM8 channel-associated factor homolog n=1 Tax=Folsomia candida TaxID=158441 RepID=UPI001604C0E2|nr:TRPM8 channel-associated factor homolog [Folsomia candida]